MARKSPRQSRRRTAPVEAFAAPNIYGPSPAFLCAELLRKDTLIGVVHGMTADGFERLCILRESGFLKVEVTGRSGDGGIDGVGVLRIALLSFQVYFQCKEWKGTARAKDIRDFRGAMVGKMDNGLFMTTGSYTSDAQKEATRDGAPAIDLADGEHLCDLLRDLKLGVTTRMVEDVSIEPDWFAQI